MALADDLVMILAARVVARCRWHSRGQGVDRGSEDRCCGWENLRLRPAIALCPHDGRGPSSNCSGLLPHSHPVDVESAADRKDTLAVGAGGSNRVHLVRGKRGSGPSRWVRHDPRISLGCRRHFARTIPFRLFPSGTQTFEPSPRVRAESTGVHSRNRETVTRSTIPAGFRRGSRRLRQQSSSEPEAPVPSSAVTRIRGPGTS